MKKRTIFIIALVVVLFFAGLVYLSNNEMGENQVGLAGFRPFGSQEQADLICIPAQESGNLYSAMQELAENNFTLCGELINNNELPALIRQIELIESMINETAVLTQRRGLLMETEFTATALSRYNLEPEFWNCSALLTQALLATVGSSCDNHAHNQRVINALLEFNEVCGDYTRFDVAIDLMLGMLPMRQSLTPSQLEFLYALEDFMAMVNEPFWEDKHENDPVITHIGMPISSPLRCPFFTIWLYEPDLMELTYSQLAEYTMALREEISRFVGSEAYRFEFRVVQCDEQGINCVHRG